MSNHWNAKAQSRDLPDWALTRLVHLRRLMLLHSCIYYHLNDSVVSDHQWQAWANELAELQAASPAAVDIGFYDEHFATWDGSTGYHLPVDPGILDSAQRLLANPFLPRNQRHEAPRTSSQRHTSNRQPRRRLPLEPVPTNARRGKPGRRSNGGFFR